MTNEKSIRKKIFDIISIGNKSDLASRVFDIALVIVIFCNLTVTLLSTFQWWDQYKSVLDTVEFVTILIFTVEYLLRLWTADFLYPRKTKWAAILAFVISISGLIDLLTFLPYYLPIFFPAGAVAFRILRVVRIFRLFRVNAQNDAFSVILDVLYEKRSQLLFSIVLILIFMIAASLCMYDLEHEAQPEAFQNAFSGIWWSVSTLLTVGYGDIYPITIAGRVMAIFISFLGVGMVAIPTGIISAGFVQQYTIRKSELYYGKERNLQFVTTPIPAGHAWDGMALKSVILPPSASVALILHGNKEVLLPKEDTILRAGDTLVLTTAYDKDDEKIGLREILVENSNEWIGKKIRALDLIGNEQVVMLKRDGKNLHADPDEIIRAGDGVVLYNR